jgi:hypothetical protein
MKATMAFFLLFTTATAFAQTAQTVPKTPAKPKYDPYQLYEEQFNAQIELTNVAMEDYAITDCSSPDFPRIAKRYVHEYNKLVIIRKSMPKGEPVNIQLRQVEVALGLEYISDDLDKKQAECFNKKNAPDETPAPSFPSDQKNGNS